jgi:hypothetical protein
MRELKYLKLFEAFESIKLTKTLGYVDSKSREELIDKLKIICSSIDFPISQLTDDYFKYLPFNKALNLQFTPEDKPCKATSKDLFGGSGIEGEVCQSGKIKRMWGSRQRLVDCSNCSGTGIQPQKSEVQLLKFWFTKEGEMVAITAVDNNTKPELKSKTTSKFNKNVSSFNLVGEEYSRRSNVSFLNHGDFVYANLTGHATPIICFVWKEGRRLYLIQDEHDGDTPSGDFRKIAKYSWNITDGDFITLRKAEPKQTQDYEDVDDEIDPYSFNRSITFSYRGVQMSRYNNAIEVEKTISKAHFALVFDISKLKSTDFKSKKEISSEREKIKSGSKLTIKDEDIRKANIQRYMIEIAKRSDIISDISNLPKVVKRMFGGENILYLIIYNSRFINTLSSLGDYYVSAISNRDNEYAQEKLSIFISDRYKSVSQYSTNVTNNLKFCKEYCKKNGLLDKIQILDDLQTLSKNLYKLVSNSKLECVEDVDILKSKLEGIRAIFRSNRYDLDYLDYFVESLSNNSPETSKRYLTEHHSISNNVDKILNAIKLCTKIVDRY